MIIDAYTMVGGYYIRPDLMGFPELFEAMSRSGLDAAVVTSMTAMYADARKGNDSLFAVAERDPRIIPIGVVSPHVSPFDVPELVEECVAKKAAGLAFWLGSQSGSLSSITFRKTLAAAAKSGLPLVFPSVMNSGVPTQITELTRNLGCPVLLVGPYYGLLGEILALLREYPHLYVDTGWQITPGAIDLLVEYGGPDRILFGSGAPARPVQPALNALLDADIDDVTKRKILAVNALKLFGRSSEAVSVEKSGFSLPEIKKPSTRAIDVHCHLGVIPGVPMPVSDVESIEYYMEKEGFEYSVCSAPVAYCDDINAGNQEMLDKIAGRPKLLGSVVISPTHFNESIGWLDIAAENRRIAHATLDSDNESERFGSERYMRLFDECAKRNIPIFYNSGSQDISSGYRRQRKLGYVPWIRGGSPDEVGMFLEVSRRQPELPIILGHGLGEDGLRLARMTRNIYLEFSGSYPERDAVRKAIDSAGKERVVFGTDLDMINPAFVFGVYYEARMSSDEERLIMAENARRILRLPKKM